MPQPLAEDCEAYLADRYAEKVLARCRDTPAPPQKLFLSLLDYKQPCSWLRAGLFELWLRAEPKPKGGRLPCGSMDDELPVLHWLLREQAAEVFQGLVGTHYEALEEFVSWFLGKVRPYTGYFTGGYKFGSFNMYAFGRPRYAAWARLAQEVQDAATSLGIPFPESLRLPAMPDLEKPTQASLVTSSTGISHRHLKRMAEQLSVREPGKRDSDSWDRPCGRLRRTSDASRREPLCYGLRVLADRSILIGWSFPLNRSRIFAAFWVCGTQTRMKL